MRALSVFSVAALTFACSSTEPGPENAAANASDAGAEDAAMVADDMGTAQDTGKRYADGAPEDQLPDIEPPDVAEDDPGVPDVEPPPEDAGSAEVAVTKDVATLPDDACTTTQGCNDGKACFAPGQSIGCGMCFSPQDTCESDTPCKAQDDKLICVPVKCACDGEKSCVEGCNGDDGKCAAWEFCAPTGHCVADVCLTDSGCLPNFVCTPPNNPHCARKPCKADDECAGFCVNGQCYDQPGFCSYQPP